MSAVNSKYRWYDCLIPKHISADCHNEFFAKISTGEHPNPEVYYSSAAKCDVEISDYQIETILRCVKRTSSGWDGLIPSCLFKKCSVALASVVTYLINLINYSISVGQIPDIWQTAIVTPVPKVPQPAACSDYRPVSVTTILSRITERTRMWANAQRDGRPAEYRWRPLFNAAKFSWCPLLDAVQ